MIEQQVEDLDPAGTLAAATASRRAADAAEARLLTIAAHWADLHPVLTGPGADGADGIRVDGMERLMPLAGPGTPPVAEFAPAELAAVLGVSSYAGQELVGDALELRHRLPRLWAAIHAGRLQAWRGRRVAQHTRCLSQAAAAWVDAQVAPFAHKIGHKRLIDLVTAAMIRFDPDAAADRAKATAKTRGVWVSDQTTDGTTAIRIEADALDAAAFDTTIAQIAAALAALGDPDQLDLRRAKALGVIADPQAALDLLHPDDTGTGDDTTGDDTTGDDKGGAAQDGSGTSRRRGRRAGPGRKRRGPKVVLYLHLHQDAIRAGVRVGRIEGLGPVTSDQIQDWAGRTDLSITPVLDLADRASVDAYEVPDRMGETVLLRNPCCPYPWCNNLTRNKDNDHATAYIPPEDGGPPGQTAADKLAPLCRRHHRLKTHGGWKYTMPEPGLYLWRSPHGHRYLVDHTGTSPHTAADTTAA
jgi:hypothetical protein